MNPHEPREEQTPTWRALDGLSQYEPETTDAERALDRARQVLGSDVTSKPRRTPWQIWKWRLLMPTGIAAILTLTISLFVTFGPTPHASAAEVLEQVIAAQKAYDGWFATDYWSLEESKWLHASTQHAGTGKRLNLLDFEDGSPLFEFTDPEGPIVAMYDSSTNILKVMGTLSASTTVVMPTTGQQLVDIVKDMRYDIDFGVDIDTQIKFTKPSLRDDATESERRMYKHLPQLIICDIDPTTSRIRQLSKSMTVGDEPRPWLRYRYDVEGIESIDDIPLPDGAKIVDNRPDQGTRDLLDRLDAVLRDGLGFDTAIVVSRASRPIQGTLLEDGTVTLYAEREDKWLKFTWTSGKDLDGWPEPTLDTVIAHLDTTPPDRAAVFDGKYCWWRDQPDSSWIRRSGSSAKEREQYNRLAYEIWWGRPRLYYHPGSGAPVITSHRDQERSNGIFIDVTVMTHWADTPEGEMSPIQTQTMQLLEDLGPLPQTKTVEQFGPDGEMRTLERWDFSITDVEMHRYPVRVPLRWSRRFESAHEPTPTYPQHYHLMPLPGQALDAEWFESPTSRWLNPQN